jgi:predicted lipoprotein with Yx(FWY)xxD motif
MHSLRRIRYRIGAVTALIGVSVLVAACGSSSSPTTATAAGAGGSTASTTATATPAAVRGTAVSTASGPDGTYLTGAGGRALYLWVADSNGKSNCSGQCAKFWPPLTTKGKPVASGSVKASQLGTVKRADGTTQVTYKHHPLYYFLEDKTKGSFKGQGSDAFGADWWLVAPSGAAITKGDKDASDASDDNDDSSSSSSASSGSSGGGSSSWG